MRREEIVQTYHLKGNPGQGLALATFGFFVGFAAVSLFGPVTNNFNHLMHMKGLLLGLLIAAPNLSGSLLRIPFGAWVDKAGGKKPFIILLLLSLLGMAGLTAILFFYYPRGITLNMYPVIFFFGLLSGCGIATFSVGVPQTSYWFPQKKQGLALGTYGGLGNTAPGVFGMILPFALAALGLTASYAAWFVFLLVGTVIYSLFAQDAYYFQLAQTGKSQEEAKQIAQDLGQELFPSGKMKEALRISAKTPKTWLLVILYFTSFGGFLALTGWFPTYWNQYFGLSAGQAGLLMALGFSILASLVRIYGGHLSDKFGGELTAVLSYGVVLSGALILIFTHNFWFALFGEITVGIGMGTANAAVFKLVPKYVPQAPGGASGWVGGLGAFGGFVVPPILGAFTDLYGKKGYAAGFWVYVVLAAIAIVTSFILRRSAQS
ncbi:Major facilitator superfamily transporter [Acididesulfobacillus acetoxydans]|uniref:Major facilitator super MFS 1 n=1 Tax=Acididesulfobacillus acetoxydans TaxID=1561005 RepID=A0A8S0WX38_9FIRM|nr:MFS transporter [Acididesulfobacillus acetoxydans]CAA7600701.1 Major facilitator superfamily transporter [Acididesulfobacillus acetoxydans]CEJ09482.1 Major facilitator super MFS 1 [Acididesulfobacillus acetoxydans]